MTAGVGVPASQQMQPVTEPTIPFRWPIFVWLYWLLRTPTSRFWARLIGVLNASYAAPFLGLLLVGLPARLAAVENPVTIGSVDAECNRWTKGGTYVIAVDGRRHACTGADSWCPAQVPTPVTFNRRNPSECRAAARVGRLSRWESVALLGRLTQLSGGLALALIHEDDPNRTRGFISHVLFLVALLLLVGLTVFDLIPHGGSA